MTIIKEELSQFPVQLEVEVQWADMDAAQHVNNTVYLRWTETARIAYFIKLGTDVTPLDGSIGYILGWQDCKYIFPVTFPDQIHIGIKIIELGEDWFKMEAHFYSQKHQRIVAISKAKVVTYNYKEQRKMNLTSEMLQGIKALEKEI